MELVIVSLIVVIVYLMYRYYEYNNVIRTNTLSSTHTVYTFRHYKISVVKYKDQQWELYSYNELFDDLIYCNTFMEMKFKVREIFLTSTNKKSISFIG